MTRLELVFVSCFILAAAYFALWGCVFSCPDPPPPCALDADCPPGDICEDEICGRAECFPAALGMDPSSCQASSVGLGECGGGDDSLCRERNTGDRCVNGIGNASTCVEARSADDPPCESVSPELVEVTVTSTQGAEVRICVDNAINCSTPGGDERGRCAGGPFGDP